MTARSKKKRSKNKAIKREKNKAKELKKLKKTLGLLDEDGMDLMDKIKDITEQKAQKEELEKVKDEANEDIFKKETEELLDHNEYVEIVNPKTSVKHVFNAKTKRDQFGSYPVWYKKKKEDAKKKIKEGKIGTGSDIFAPGSTSRPARSAGETTVSRRLRPSSRVQRRARFVRSCIARRSATTPRSVRVVDLLLLSSRVLV